MEVGEVRDSRERMQVHQTLAHLPVVKVRHGSVRISRARRTCPLYSASFAGELHLVFECPGLSPGACTVFPSILIS